jgi:hypothetical protein
VANGGTGASTAAGARTNLGLDAAAGYATLLTTSGTWTAPYAGKYKFTIVGGGGGGGYYGGGSGGYAVSFQTLTKNNTITATIGAGGAGGSSGIDGGNTTLGSITATGGRGGGSYSGSSNAGDGGLPSGAAGNNQTGGLNILNGYGYGGNGNASSNFAVAGGQGCVLIEYIGA